MRVAKVLRVVAVTTVFIFGFASALQANDPLPATYRIKNAWLADQNGQRPVVYINTEKGLAASPIESGWLSARWSFEQVESDNGTKLFRLRNRNSAASYLHVENNRLECTEILVGWQSAQWKFEEGPDPGMFRIRNAWRDNYYIHVQNGRLEAGPIEPGWLSAAWILEKVN